MRCMPASHRRTLTPNVADNYVRLQNVEQSEYICILQTYRVPCLFLWGSLAWRRRRLPDYLFQPKPQHTLNAHTSQFQIDSLTSTV